MYMSSVLVYFAALSFPRMIVYGSLVIIGIVSPEMTWGRSLKKALKYIGLPVNFKEWRAIAEDRSE